jgi:hypothetical protein
MKRTEAVLMHCTPEEKAAVAELAKAEDRSESSVVRLAVSAFLARSAKEGVS